MIKLYFTAMLVSVFSTAAFASVGPSHTFMCNVVGFDTKQAVLACDPKKPANRMTTPREWINAESKLKSDTVIKFGLDDQQFEKWLALNKSPIAQTKEKNQ